MRFAVVFVPFVGLAASIPPAMAQERIPAPLSASIAREAVRLSTEAAARVVQGGSASAAQANSSRPAETLTVGTRVRVTASSSVEVPGGTTIQPLPVLASDEVTETFRLAGGQRVTVPRPRAQVDGRFEGWDGQNLTVTRADGTLVTVPRGAIARLERRNGQADRVGSGLLIGAGIGILAGVGYASSHCRGGGCYAWVQPTMVGLSTVLGCWVGTMVGHAFSNPWTKVELSALGK
jgi:hypothetical protein